MKISKLKKYLIIFTILLVSIIFMPNDVQAGSYSIEHLASKLHEIRNTSGYMHGEYYKWNDGGWYSDYCSSGHAGWQCHGYGINLFDWLFNQCAMCSSRVYDMNQVCVGDLIRYNNAPYGEHTIIVQDVVGDTVYFTDANGLGTGTVRWDQTFSKSYLQERLIYIAHASGNDIQSLTADTTAPTLSDMHIHTSSIGEDSVNVRIKASDNVGVTGVKFKVWQSGNSEDSGTTKWGTSIGNGYYEVKFTAEEANKEEDNLCCVKAWAYDEKGNESSAAGIYDFVFGQKATNLGSFVARIVPTKNTNYCIGVSGTEHGDDLKLKTKNLSDSSQLWKFEKRTDGTYKITHLSSGKSFDTEGGEDAKADRTIMQIADYVEGASQMTYLIESYNGAYRIVPTNQDEVRGVDIRDAQIVENQIIQVHKANSKDNVAQTWSFEKVATSLAMGSTSTTVKVGASKKLATTITPSDVATKTLQWSSSNTSIAKVSSSGVVTGVKTGSVTITVKTTDGSNKTATCKVVVTLPYTDVNTSDWYYYAVEYVHNNNYMSGTTQNKVFSPNDKLTRAMLVTILHRMEGSPYVSGTSKFSDVQDTSAYYYVSVKWATANKIVSGYDNGKFGPNDPITREQLAVMLNSYCKYKGKYKSVNANLSQYKDGAKISEFAKWGMNWAVGSGVITGTTDGYLNPQGTATRAEAASMIYKYCLNIK